MSSQNVDRPFEAGTYGATLARDLLWSLALRPFDEAGRMLDRVVEHPLIRSGFEREHRPMVLGAAGEWLAGTDPGAQYRLARLVMRGLDRLALEPDERCLEAAMSRAYAAGDLDAAAGMAEQLLQAGEQTSPSARVRSHDVLGRLRADLGDLSAAARSFAAGAEAARAAGMDFDEWDHRTNLIWCHFSEGRYLDALREIDRAEAIARHMGRADALLKTLIDRGNAEQRLGRKDRARAAYEAVLTEAERANDRARQSDALGNLGNLAYQDGDLGVAEGLHRRALEISRTLSDRSSAQYDLNNLAVVLWEQQRSGEAVEALEEALAIAGRRGDQGNAGRYRQRLFKMYEVLGRHAAAEAVVLDRGAPGVGESADTVAPGAAPVAADEDQTKSAARELKMRVRRLLNGQDVVGARRLLEERVAQEPGDWRARCLLGAVLDAQSDPRGARALYLAAMEIAPHELDPFFRLADSHRRTDELDALVAHYRERLDNEPFHAGVRLVLALAFAWTGRAPDAIQQALEAVALAPDDELPVRALAEAQNIHAHRLLDENWDGAWLAFADCMTTLLRLTRLDAEDAGQYLAYAGLLFENFAMASYRANPPLFGGMEFRELELLAHAIRFYERAGEQDPTRAEAAQRAAAQAQQIIIRLGSPEQLTTAAEHLRLDAWPEEALLLLALSLRLAPERADTLHQMALVLRERGPDRREQACALVRRAIELDPGNASYRQTEQTLRQPAPAAGGLAEPGNG
jgi:tetratricopeptide (TPR) repeat protein